MVMICDGVVANMTSLYLGVIVIMKLFGLITERSFSGCFVVAVSTFVVGSIFIGALTWDVSRKATYATSPDRYYHLSGRGGGGGKQRCHGGGICWHGVSVESSVSQIRFQLPQQPLTTLTLS
ncbi:transmembrane protein [Thalictrum thalictroides]|uniref:Transmembrane protein n=1 Tax=Thalictrum thalictroides TaxID=46969 RepID=A0A7J6WW96_THATH|nr:transmembrane protein [Thalictrum thalictroides]